MSAPDSCTPCDCIPPKMDKDYFLQALLVILCDILNSLEGG